MSAPRIVRVGILPMGMVNCHLIIGVQGCILVDAGLPGYARKIEKALRRNGLGFTDIRLIVITHAHVDHAGGAARIRALSGAPIVAQVGDLDYYQQKKAMDFCPTGRFARWFLRTGFIRRTYAPFTPDILMQDGDAIDLAPYGFVGKLFHTPGHTQGSIAVELASGDALVGDLVASGVLLGGIVRKGDPIRPPFEDDPHRVAQHLQSMVDAGVQRFHMGHGGPLNAKTVCKHVHHLRKLDGLPEATLA